MSIKKISYYVSISAIFLIPIFPLIVANSYFFPFITGKAFYFRILVEIAVASWIILCFLDAKYRPKITPIGIGITTFAFIALLADLLGVNPIRSFLSNFERMEGWITIIHLWAFFIITTSLFGSGEEGKRNWQKWLNFSLFVGFIVACYGLLQFFGLEAIHQSAARIDASLGNSAYMAVYMIMNIGIAMYLFFVYRMTSVANRTWFIWVYPILSVIFSFIVFETATRGSIIGLVAGIMISLALYSIFGKGETKRKRWISGGIIIFVILVGFIFYASRNSSFVKNNDVLNRLGSISLSEFQNEGRSSIWPMAIKGSLERPILGWGQENFNYIFNANYAPKMFGQEQWFDRAHSVFLDWLVASGFVGLFAYLALYILFLYAVWKSSNSFAVKSTLTGLLAAYAIHNIFVFDNLASYVMFFAFLGLVSSFKEGKEITLIGNQPIRTDAVEYIVAPITIILAVVAIYVFNIRSIQANTDLIKALSSCSGSTPDATLFEKALNVNSYMANQEIREQVLTCSTNVIGSQSVPSQTKQQFYQLAVNEIGAQVAATPKDARIYVLGGTFFDQLGQFQQGEALLVKANELSPNKQMIEFELANAYLNEGKNDDAVAILKHTYETSPKYDQVNIAYAVTLIIVGKEAEAHQLFDNDPKIFQSEQIAQAYVSTKQYSKAIAIYKNLIIPIVATSSDSINLNVRLAQIQYAAGMISASVQTLKGLEVSHPELQSQIDAAIKQIQTK